MLKISKKEAFALRKEHPDVEIYRTMRQRSQRGRYYCPEYDRVVKFLENFWKSKIDAKAGQLDGQKEIRRTQESG